MGQLKTFFIPLIFSGLLFSCIIENPSPVPQEALEYKSMTNVPYGDHPKQVYDIILPQNRTLDTKIMVLIHGGGWRSGSKYDMIGFRDFIRDQFPEVALVNMNYRLADKGHSPFPMQIEDISAVIQHLQDNQHEYKIGKELGMIGASAGGHLALLWSYAYDSNNKVNMVGSMVGPTNLLDEAYLNTTNPELKELLDLFGRDEVLLEAASPLHQASPSSPPTLLFYGGQDPLVPNSQGRSLNKRLAELGVPKEFHFYPYEGHGWIGLNLLDSSLKLKAFIDKNL